MNRILVLCPYPEGSAPGQRFGFEQYLAYWREAGFEVVVQPFLDLETWRILYRPGFLARKAWGVLRGFFRRAALVPFARRFDFVLIFREASPIGPPVFEALLFLLGSRVILVFDDAIFLERTSKANRFLSLLKFAGKTRFTARRAYKVVGANRFLADWARGFNKNVLMIPSTIDPSYHRRPDSRGANPVPVVGWTGSHSTSGYLEIIRPVLAELQRSLDFEFRVICDVDPGFPELKRYRFVKWRLDSEIEDLAAFDVGLMPVPDGPWELGKVGMKAVQYAALEIASVVSATGSGGEVVLDGRTGFVVENDPSRWRRALERLISEPGLRTAFGRDARSHILKNYSVPSQRGPYLSLFT